MTQSNLTDREKFEWCCANGGHTELNDKGEYSNTDLQQRWIGWQAATAGAEKEISKLKHDCANHEFACRLLGDANIALNEKLNVLQVPA
ncbi:hypothetical protein Slit_1931 [Sideroxydans lithotrophicus ES-1]|uniref:Uncharacterized protein n=2 Tax=Sideroxydans TaxID=314343 RepID=D5CT74_SIDLE|nr:hypothetical protein Slit_1931 [Sideroxydans lithotrophicus ES-1]